MIDLTFEQCRELTGPEFAKARDPETGRVYVLVDAEHYEKMRKVIDGVSRRAGWDEPEMDEIYRKKSA